jgi:hypothetical protein
MARTHKLAGIGELALEMTERERARGSTHVVRKQVVYAKMNREGAPPSTKVSRGAARVWWFDDAMTWLENPDAKAAHAPWWDPPKVVALADVADKAGKPRSKVWDMLNRPDGPPFVHLSCGKVYPNPASVVAYVKAHRTGGRRLRPVAAATEVSAAAAR